VRLWMSKPSGFNDPWDCGFPILADLVMFGVKHEAECRKNYDIVFQGELRRLFEPPEPAFNRPSDSGSASSAPLAHCVEERLGQLAVAYFFGDLKNGLLWSYYANHHRGMCLRYEYRYVSHENPDPTITTPTCQVFESFSSR